jgi:D-aminopeptidase
VHPGTAAGVHASGSRLRDAGFRPESLHAPGPWNAITDVAGVSVGHAAVEEPGRTGVTVIVPRPGDLFERKCPAAVWALNGAGACTGSLQINEWGVLESPVFLTGTTSVGRVYDGALDWLMARSPRLAAGRAWVIPCVAECNDGWLNDARSFRAGAVEVEAALASATGGPVAEGGIGGGRGMIAFDLKGGIGTASRVVAGTGWTVGALVNCNHGARQELTIAGVRLGDALGDVPGRRAGPGEGSVITVLATDAPLQHPALSRLCKRGALGLGRAGASGQHGSGDILIAFSTVGETAPDASLHGGPEVWGRALGPLFQAAVEAVEEAVWNAVWAGEDMVGREGRTVSGLPRERALEVLRGRRPDLFPAG